MKKFLGEFKEFALKGNMFDLAVGVIVGAAFNSVVKSIVNDIFTPIIGMLMGGLDFSKLCVTIGSASVTYGLFIQNIINFLITAFSLFIVVKAMNRFKKAEEAKEPETPADIKLLEEIRDAIKSNKEWLFIGL